MKAQGKEEKAKIKFGYAAALYKALQNSPLNSFRKLAKEAGMESAHIQKISVGKLDVSVTTSVALAGALGITYSQLSTYYDELTEEDIGTFVQYLAEQKKLRGKAKGK